MIVRMLCLVGTLVVGQFSVAEAADWPKWRGAGWDGVAGPGSYPVEFNSTRNVLWKVALPGKGFSTPVVRDGAIFITAPVDGEDAVIACDWSGKVVWKTKLGPEVKGKHKNGSGSNPSVATDEDGLFASFRSGNFAALDRDGKLRWKTNLVERFGKDSLYWSHGSSPVVTDKFVVVTRMCDEGSWVAAFDKKSGELAWKVAREYETPSENDHSYATPLVLDRDGKERLLVWGAEHLTMHDTADGKLLWSCGVDNKDGSKNWPVVSSPLIAGEMVVVSFGRSDRRQPQLHGIRLGGKGDVSKTNHAWRRDDTGSFVPTPALADGRLYLVQDLGQLDCVDPVSGKTLFSAEFPKDKSRFYASPVIAGDKLYTIREDGKVFVWKVGEGFELLAENDMGEKVIASPVLLDGKILIRGEKNLFCIGE